MAGFDIADLHAEGLQSSPAWSFTHSTACQVTSSGPTLWRVSPHSTGSVSRRACSSATCRWRRRTVASTCACSWISALLPARALPLPRRLPREDTRADQQLGLGLLHQLLGQLARRQVASLSSSLPEESSNNRDSGARHYLALQKVWGLRS